MKFLRALALSLLVCAAALAQSAALLPVPKAQFLDANGYPLSGGLVYTCVAGASCPGTPLASYTDSTAGTPNANPVVLDASGSANIWLGSSAYKIVVQSALGVTISSTDNVTAGTLGSLAATGSKGAFAVGGALTVAGAATVSGALNALSLDTTTQFADQFSGSDAGAKITAAIAALPAAGGTVDARGFTGAQTAAATITISKPVTLLLGAYALTLSGNPGINVTSGGVRIEGIGQPVYGVLGNGSTQGPSVLISGVAAALVNAATTGTSGPTIHNLELNGAGVGTYGLNASRTGPSSVTVEAVNVHGFMTVGLNLLGGLFDVRRAFVSGNAEGMDLGSDGSVDQYTEVSVNTGIGIHVLYGGSRIRAMSDYNGSYGIYLDGRANANSATQISDCYVDDNGGDNIRIEGQSSGNHNAVNNHVSNCYIAQAQVVGVAADAIRVLNASGTVLNDNSWLGAGLSGASVLDSGGIVVSNSDNTKVNGFDAQYSTQTALSVLSSTDTRIIGLHARNTAISTTATANSYALLVDAATTRTYVYSSDATDDRGTGYSRGVDNLGSATQLIGWTTGTPVSSPDSLGSASYLSGVNGQMNLQAPNWIIANSPVEFGSGSQSTLTQVQYLTGSTCTTAASVGATCATTALNFANAFADGNYRAVCSLTSPTTGVPLLYATTKATTSLGVSIAAGTAAAASANYECMAFHQ